MKQTDALFSVFEFSPATFAKAGQTIFRYSLTLVLQKDGGCLLYLASPGFRPSLPDAAGVETIIQTYATRERFNRRLA